MATGTRNKESEAVRETSAALALEPGVFTIQKAKIQLRKRYARDDESGA